MDKVKKILIVISGLKIGGGAEKSATMVGNGLYEKGYNVKYLTFYDAEEKYDFKGEEICLNENISKNILLNMWKLIKRAWKIKKYCKKNNIESCLSFMEEANFPNVISKMLGNKAKIIISVRINLDMYKGFLYRKLIKLLYPKANFVVPIVKEETQNLIHKYGIKPEKVQNIYNMFDIKSIQEKSKEDLGDYKELFSNGKFTFINIGRLSNQKNHQLLLDSFDKFHKQNKNSQLIILGDGKLKEELKKQKNSLSSKEDINFLGVHENPYKFLANADTFVFSSSWEGMGRVLVEAMACGIPVISTDCKVGPKEVLRKNPTNFEMVEGISKEDFGILVSVNYEKSFSQAMQDLYNDKNLQEYYIKQSKIRIKDFDTKNILSEWESIL